MSVSSPSDRATPARIPAPDPIAAARRQTGPTTDDTVGRSLLSVLHLHHAPSSCAGVDLEDDAPIYCGNAVAFAWLGELGTLVPWCAAHVQPAPPKSKYRLVRIEVRHPATEVA